MPRLTLMHLTNYKGAYVDAWQNRDRDIHHEAVWFQAVPGGLDNSQPSSRNVGNRWVRVGPGYFNQWMTDGKWSLYIVGENEGKRKARFRKENDYFYKLLLVEVGSKEEKAMKKEKCKSKFEKTSASKVFDAINDTCNDLWDLDNTDYRAHVHIGICHYESMWVGRSGLDEMEEFEEEEKETKKPAKGKGKKGKGKGKKGKGKKGKGKGKKSKEGDDSKDDDVDEDDDEEDEEEEEEEE